MLRLFCPAVPIASCNSRYACDLVKVDAQILETKTRKLEQLVRLKDAKIDTLIAKLNAAGLSGELEWPGLLAGYQRRFSMLFHDV
jgi:hypothetical protein